MFFNSYNSRRRKQSLMNMDEMRDSSLLKVLAVGTLVYLGAKTINRMMEE